MSQIPDIYCDIVPAGNGCRCLTCKSLYPVRLSPYGAVCPAKRDTEAYLRYQEQIDREFPPSGLSQPTEVQKLEQARKIPSIHRRAGNFAKAMARWVAAGRPRRAPGSVRAIFETYCSKCPLFVAELQICAHDDCGCRVTGEHEIRNKLSWATEGCPDDPPKFLPML